MKVLITNIFGKENKGDQALFETLIYFLLSRKSIDEIKLMAHYTEGLTEYSDNIKLYKPVNNIKLYGKIKAILIPFILLISYLYIRIPFFGVFLSKWQKESINSYKDVDLVISCPGGFLEDSSKAYFASLFQLYLAIIFKKKIIIAPQSIGPIRGNFSKYLLKKILYKVEKIYTRETFSYKFITEDLKLNKSKVEMSADMAFFYDEYKKLEFSFRKNESLLYSTVVNWNFPDATDKLLARKKYIEAMAGFYQYIYEMYALKIVILNQVNSDLPIAYEIQEIVGREIVTIDEVQYEPLEMIKKISNTKYFVGTRFHSCIFSMLGNVPFIAISYLPKTHGIMEYLDLLGYELDIYTLTKENLITQFDIMIKEEKNFIREIQKKLIFLKNKNNFQKYINSIL